MTDTVNTTKTIRKKNKNGGFRGLYDRFMDRTEGRRVYALVFLLPVITMYLVYAFFEVHPFGGNSVLVLDLNGQYVYYYEAMRDAFWGDGSLMYDWSRNLSGEMFGIFGYYLASPFMIIVCLMPRTAMCGAIELMQLMKVGTAAVTFAYLLRFTGKPKNGALIAFSTFYSLMAYMIVQFMDPMWLDGLIYLPLIIVGVHKLVDNGKMAPYIIPLSLMFIAHFYIGYMIGFFTFIYFVAYCFSKEGRIFAKGIEFVLLRFIAGTVVAILCSCIVLIPVVSSLRLGKLEFTTPDWSMATQFDFLTFITKLFPMSYDTVYPEGLPMIYCGTAILLLVPLFFMNDKIGMKQKVSKGLVCAVLFISMYIRPVDIVWHGFQVPNWLPFRYSFAFSLMFVWMGYEAFEHSDGITSKQIGGVFTALLAFLFWCERENYEHFQIFDSYTDDAGEVHWKMQGIWFSVIALSIYFVLIHLHRKYKASKPLAVITVMLVCAEMFCNASDTLVKIDKDVAYSTYYSYEPYMSNTREFVQEIKDKDDSLFYRSEATFHRTVNDPIGTDYHGLSHSSSTMNSPALTLLKQLGFAYGGHYTKYDGATLLTDSFFDIKYLMDKEGNNNRYVDSRIKVPEEYKLAGSSVKTNLVYEKPSPDEDKQEREVEETYLYYENPYALGLGMVSSDRILDAKLSDQNPFENQNQIFNCILGGDTFTQFFTRLTPVNSDRENVNETSLVDGHKKFYKANTAQAESHVDYVVRMDKDSKLYMYLPSKYERKCNIWVQDEDEFQVTENEMDFAGAFFEGDDLSTLCLGEFKKGQEIRIRITLIDEDNEAFWLDELFYTFDFDAFEKAVDRIREHGVLDLTDMGDRFVKGTVNAQGSDKYLLTTIPDEDGWVVKVNGKKVDYEVTLGTLITIPLESGNNEIEMTFSPNYFKLAVVLTIIGLLMLAGIFMFEYRDGIIIEKIMSRDDNYHPQAKIEKEIEKQNKRESKSQTKGTDTKINF